MINPIVLDGTRPVETHTQGPGRLAHAFPEGSLIALCGHTRPELARPPTGTRCAVCEREATRKNWVAR